MTLAPGARLGPYEVLSPLGTGGMGEVWRARDIKLNRDVAIKILPDVFAHDADRVARFTREAQALAALNHPNIAQIYGVIEEAQDGSHVHALVMELVEGEDLSDVIARGPMPVADALPIARQIADALEAAHEQGIIHRDLKPGNIKLRADGTVKVLDFGLAKALAAPGSKDPGLHHGSEPGLHPSTGGADAMNSPTLTARGTQMGLIIGTAAYMAPEQARGKPVDKRADVWAFGAVLYEMLTGRRAFPGDDISDVLAAVLRQDIDWAALPADTPIAIRRLLERSLQKDRAERLRDIADARIEIRDALSTREAGEPGRAASRRIRRRERVAWIASLVVLAAALAASLAFGRRAVPDAPELRVDIVTPESPSPQSVAISPDGRTLAYVAASGTESRLWLRPLDLGAARALPGTEDAVAPFWSPDGKSIGFVADGTLKRVDVESGSVRSLADAGRGGQGTWGTGDVILFASLGRSISRVPAAGGEVVLLEGLARQGSDFAPRFLPDGRHFLYYVRAKPEIRGVYVAGADGSEPARRLLDADAGAAYAPPGYLLFPLHGTLFGQRFDASRLELRGDPFPVVSSLGDVFADFCPSVSDTGTIAYRPAGTSEERQFVWFDRSGREVARVGGPDRTGLSQPALSPDGTRVALYREVDGNVDVWVEDVRRGTWTRITSDPSDDVFPVWSPDGRRIAFSSNRKGDHDLYLESTAGGGKEELLLSTPTAKVATDWSSDGRYLLFGQKGSKTGFDIWALAIGGDRRPFPVVQGAFDEQSGQFSPDGHWIAYQSNESGRDEIYLQPFPGPGDKVAVSTAGGTEPRWSRDGKEIFYLARNGVLTTARIDIQPGRHSLQAGQPTALFAPPVSKAVQEGDTRHQYMVSPDGQRVLVAATRRLTDAPISLILHWRPSR